MDWSYRVTLASPSGSVSLELPYSEVLHFRIRVDARYPWRGRSPWQVAQATSGLAAQLEANLTAEQGGPVGSIIPVPNLAGAAGIANELPNLRGHQAGASGSPCAWDRCRRKPCSP